MHTVNRLDSSGSDSETPTKSVNRKSMNAIDSSSDDECDTSMGSNRVSDNGNGLTSKPADNGLSGKSEDGICLLSNKFDGFDAKLSHEGKSKSSKAGDRLSSKPAYSTNISCRKQIDFSGTEINPAGEQRGTSKTDSNKVKPSAISESDKGQDQTNKPSPTALITPKIPVKNKHGSGRRSFSPGKVTSNLAPVSNFVFKREMEEIRCSLNSLKVTTNKIYNCVCPITASVHDNVDNRGMPAIPVDSFENLVIWEKFLQDHDNSIHIVRLLTERCMSSSLRDSVYGMLKFIVSNKVACAFNAKGKNKKNAKVQKLSFQTTRSCAAMTAALRAYESNMNKIGSPLSYAVNAVELVKTVGLWLKDAPKRYLIDLKSSKQVPHT